MFPNDFLMNLIPFFVPSSQVSFLTDQMLSWQIVTVLLSLSVDEFHRVVLLPILFLLIIDDLLNLASYLLICCYTIHCSVSPDKCMIGITQFLRSCCRMSKFSFCYFWKVRKNLITPSAWKHDSFNTYTHILPDNNPLYFGYITVN